MFWRNVLTTQRSELRTTHRQPKLIKTVLWNGIASRPGQIIFIISFVDKKMQMGICKIPPPTYNGAAEYLRQYFSENKPFCELRIFKTKILRKSLLIL